MITLLTAIMVFLAVIIIIISFLMAPDSNSFSGALVGSSDLDLFKVSKEQGYKKVLKILMFTAGIFLFVFAIVIRLFY
ncbi:preprotein translocase subunit SecG [Mycoplasma iguanae]|uniref:Protein-export membrane protein SecG n=1 Tax=Mycoplasma iguanae TaxID=292461 RepID=A0ABY5R7J7_9MOLU|nr:preprotein translocase subunit SecG [Mycoplasma iguanae]UVD81454.1 preprotein translocase subunit SecG [Mycoplasma iguanae]